VRDAGLQPGDDLGCGVGQAVLDALQVNLQDAERRAELVSDVCHGAVPELVLPFQVGGHGVERGGHRGDRQPCSSWLVMGTR